MKYFLLNNDTVETVEAKKSVYYCTICEANENYIEQCSI